MKMFKLKNKIISILGAFVMLFAFGASIFSGLFNSGVGNFDEFETSYAVTDYDEYADNVVEEISSADLSSLGLSYSLVNNYPIFTENQDDSSLCWVYTASKALESTLMIATGEYYNFSEIATAYFAYLDGTNSSINSFGSFEKFDYTIRKNGVVLESVFSNDIYYDINETNHTNYSYVKDFADKDIAKQVVPIYLSSNVNFKSSNNQENIIKYYIKNHGALNLALPANSMIRTDADMGYAFEDTIISATEGKAILENHAVTLVGWNEFGFIALNSWGVDVSESYENIVIPYGVMEKYYNDEILFKGELNPFWLCGYDYVGGESVKLIDTSADEFSAADGIVVNATNPMKNIFCFTESISMTFEINDVSNFETVYVSVYKGLQDVTSLFRVSYDDIHNLVTIFYEPTSADFVATSETFAGGTYAVRFFEDVNLLATKSVMIYTGTEVSYFKFYNTKQNSKESYYSLFNTSATAANSDTYYIYQEGSYKLDFYLTHLNRTNSLMMFVQDTQVYNAETNSYENVSDLTGIVKDSSVYSTSGNRYSIFVRHIPSNYMNKLIRFKVSIISPDFSVGCVGNYYFEVFVSGHSTATSSDYTYDILYSLDGGKNDSRNIDKYPIYSKDSSMTTFKLFNPTKLGYEFEGWYLDANFETKFEVGSDKIPKITSANSGFLVLYAKWFYTDTEYFSMNLTTSNIYNYDDTEKDLTGLNLSSGAVLTYGESIKLKNVFTMESAIRAETFSFKYYYYVNGVQIDVVDLITTADSGNVETAYTVYFGGLNDEIFGFPNLEVGNYKAKIVAVAVIRHKFSISRTIEYNVEVQKKEVGVVYNQAASSVGYDSKYHMPVAEFSGYYAEDALDFANVLFNEDKKFNAGSYTFTIKDITNDNYYLKESDKEQEYLLVISPRQLDIKWGELTAIYNGRKHIPTYVIDETCGLLNGDSVSISFDSEGYVNAGTYTFTVGGVTNHNYSVSQNQKVNFEIKPAPLTVKFDNVEERAQAPIIYRTQITFKIEGILYDSADSLNIVGTSEGLTKTDSGEYIITGTYDNDNYDITFVPGIYELTGYYYVYYTLPNGEIYEELVNYGEKPKGITDEIYKVSGLKKLKYSNELVETGDDIYITVTVENNAYYILIGGGIIGFILIYWFASRKARRNKVR